MDPFTTPPAPDNADRVAELEAELAAVKAERTADVAPAEPEPTGAVGNDGNWRPS